MGFKKKGTDEIVELPNPSEETKKEVKEDKKEIPKPITIEDVVQYCVSLEQRIANIESFIYRLKSL